MTLLYTDAVFQRHDTGPGHPEPLGPPGGDRRSLERDGAEVRCVRLDVDAADDATIARAHSLDYVRFIEKSVETAPAMIDSGDTIVSAHSNEVARSRRRCGRRRRAARGARRRPERPVFDSAAGASRAGRRTDGVLPVQQRRDRRPRRAPSKSWGWGRC